MHEISAGIWRLTLRLPWALDHVHAYLLQGPDGWVLVDTGLGTPESLSVWEQTLGSLDGPVARIVVTHFHPDHIGCAADLAVATGAPVFQGARDQEIAARIWGGEEGSPMFVDWYRRHGMPADQLAELVVDVNGLRDLVHWPRDPQLLAPGDRFEAAGEAWEAHHMPGHADGLLVFLGTSSRRLLASDHLLFPITPNIGLHPESWPDPLGNFLRSLARTAELGAVIAFGGHRDPILDPAGRARELLAHHGERLELALAAVGPGSRTAYEVSLGLFGEQLVAHGRRFAIAETLAHLARLELEGRCASRDADGLTVWSLAA